MSDRIKCLVLTKDKSGKVSVVAELESADALQQANDMAAEGGHNQVEVFSPDSGAIFFDDGSMKAYNDALEADRKKKAEAAKLAEKEATANRIAELEAELADLKPAAKKTAKKK